MKLFIRAYGNCGSLEEAKGISDAIRLALSQFDPEDLSEPKPYWKMPELFEFSFNLSPATEISFLQLVKSCGEGWLHLGDGQDRASVWNRVEGCSFLTPSVAWAELALMP